MENRADVAGLRDYDRAIALQTGWRKPSRHAVSAQFLGLSAAWRPRFDDPVSQRPGRDTKGRQYAPVCGFALFVIVDPPNGGSLAAACRSSPIEALIELSETLLSPLSGLRILAAEAARLRFGIEILIRALSKLIQNLQKLNQLVKSNRKVTQRNVRLWDR